MQKLDLSQPIWSHFFLVAPLVVVGSLDAEGEIDFAPKHMAFPMGWDNYFGFICAPTHRTHQNILKRKCFTVSYPRPDQLLLASLAASPCHGEVDKSEVLRHLNLSPAEQVEGQLLSDAYLHLECQLENCTEFGRNSLIVGKIVAARVHPDALRLSDQDDLEKIHAHPLLAYLAPGRYSIIQESSAFPYPYGYSR